MAARDPVTAIVIWSPGLEAAAPPAQPLSPQMGSGIKVAGGATSANTGKLLASSPERVLEGFSDWRRGG